MDDVKIASELVRLARELISANVRILSRHKNIMEKLIRKYQSGAGDISIEEFQRPIDNFDDLSMDEIESWLTLMIKTFKKDEFERESQEILAYAFNDIIDEIGLRGYPTLRAY